MTKESVAIAGGDSLLPERRVQTDERRVQTGERRVQAGERRVQTD